MNAWRCSQCGNTNPPGAVFCGACGAALPAAPPGVRCRHCGFDENAPNAAYCVNCGRALRRKSRAGWFIIGGLLAVLLALGAAGVFLWRAGWIQDQLPKLPPALEEAAVQVGLLSPTPRRPAEPDPTATPSPTRTATPTAVPSPTPSLTATPSPTTAPSATPTPSPTATPTDTATPSPTPLPTATPTPVWAPSASFDLLVSGTQARNPAGIQITAGERVRIDYLSGRWRAGPPPAWNLVGPEGDPQVSSKASFPVPQAALMSLVAGVDNGTPVLVGSGTEFEAAAGGLLWLGANDDRFDDNQGDLLVRIQVAKPWATPPPPLPAGQIVFTCYIGEFDEICRMDTDGGNQARLTDDDATDWYASYSPDGRQIVFSSRRDGEFEIYTMNADGSNQRRLTQGLGSLYAPAISPDGRRILFSSYRGNRQNLWLMNVDGSGAFQITDMPAINEDPVWSPDGAQIAFASDRDGEIAHYLAKADGSGIQRIPAAVDEIGGRCDWSPDGRWLAFYAGPEGDRDIYLVAIDGSEVRRLTYGGVNAAPSFSPDGQWITFMSRRDGDAEIYVMRPDGTGVTQLTFNDRPDWQPRWGSAR